MKWIARLIRMIRSPKSQRSADSVSSAAGAIHPKKQDAAARIMYNGTELHGVRNVKINPGLPPVFNNYTAHYPPELKQQISIRDTRI